MIEVYAGPVARERIRQHGFVPELFSTFLGASGGPKWFVLYGLDQYFFGEFFANRQQPLNLLGSSAGAFRCACFAQASPLAALEVLTRRYTDTVYSRFASPAQVSGKVQLLLDEMFAGQAIAEVLNNQVFKLHMVVARCQGLAGSENRLLQLSGLLASKRKNRISRTELAQHYQRYVFQSADSRFAFDDASGIPTVQVALSAENLLDAVLASGSLPVLMQGVADIAGCAPGIYRDGGIVDYQFDLNIHDDGLVLYPHYSASLKPGWFDKNLLRKAAAANHQRTVLICPSPRFVESLPYRKIPDRSDFSKMDDQQRISYWRQVVAATAAMAEQMAVMVEHQRVDDIRDIAQLTQA